MTGTDRGPGVRFPPPTLFVTGLAVAWLLDARVRQLTLVNAPDLIRLLQIVGFALVVLGLLLAAWGALTFLRHKTAIIPHYPASVIVESGPYRFTRNPMYLGFVFAYIGGAFAMNTWWAMMLLPVVMILLHRFVIEREERYLTETFAHEYIRYQGRVRRWFG